MPTPIFFLPKNSFSATELEEGQIRKYINIFKRIVGWCKDTNKWKTLPSTELTIEASGYLLYYNMFPSTQLTTKV